ncbi:thiamine-phosphate kinase [Alistipes sp. ZOR0009]|uniref:thiamine-phosphate kinase n=1 Tax=Alistipes sp. ZOR0009 TaxID=1339253 RepID=UPI000647A50F|nr:thiamine-phosphate kinase [Alistipes sp. ZOR0009]
MSNNDVKRTELATLGEFGLIDHLTSSIKLNQPTTRTGVGDDAAVIDAGDKYMLLTTDLLLEGIQFDLTYTPLRHLGYKAVVANIMDIYAMNGTPTQLTISLGISKRFSVEMLDELYDGIRLACETYQVDLVGGDTTSSLTGLAISVSVVGFVDKDKITYRSGAKANDLICVSGNLGAAFMGLQILEREKQVFAGNDKVQPQLEGFDYVLKRQLKPEARKDIVDQLRELGIQPTSMIDLSDGLASDLMQIAKSSKAGVRIYLEKIPIASETFRAGEELNFDPAIAALNGGEDYELLFTIPIEKHDEVKNLGGIDVIGHITAESKGNYIVTPDGGEIPLQAQGWATE